MLRRLSAAVLAIGLAACVAAPGGAQAASGARALELITPPQPVNASILGTTTITHGGERLAYVTLGPLPGAPAGDGLANNVATRGGAGWSTTPIGFPYTTESAPLEPILVLEELSEDLRTTIWTATVPVMPGSPPAGERGLYRRGAAGQGELLADLGTAQIGLVAASADASRVVFATGAHLLPSDAGRSEGRSIYESDGSQLRQVDLAGDGSLLSSCGSEVSESGVSRSAGRVFFTNPRPSAPCAQKRRVYLREGASTVEVSASRCSRPDCNPPDHVDFVGATPDGDSAFLVTAQQLTDDDLDSGTDLYRYDVAAASLSLLTPASAGAAGAVSSLPVLTSEDGDRVYLRSQGRLLTDLGAAAGPNLYLADAGGLHFVAAVAAEDPLQISADGSVALLETGAALAGDDIDGRRDVYRYDAVAKALTGLSFGPGFGGGPFDARLGSPPGIGGELLSRSLSDDGEVLLFGTAEPLLAADGNEANDVYESDGSDLRLLSGAAGASGATFAGLSGDGGTAVLRTAAALLPSDLDGGDFDLYAARIGGGFPPAGTDCGACGDPTAAANPTAADPAGPNRLALRIEGRRLARQLARHGRAVLVVSVPAAGRVSARATGRLGGRMLLLARGAASAPAAGTVRVVLHATAAGRRRLAGERALPVTLELRQGDLRLARRVVLRAPA